MPGLYDEIAPLLAAQQQQRGGLWGGIESGLNHPLTQMGLAMAGSPTGGISAGLEALQKNQAMRQAQSQQMLELFFKLKALQLQQDKFGLEKNADTRAGETHGLDMTVKRNTDTRAGNAEQRAGESHVETLQSTRAETENKRLTAREKLQRLDEPDLRDTYDANGNPAKSIWDPVQQKHVQVGGAKVKDISPTDKKAIFEAEDALPPLDNTLSTLKRAKELNSQTFTGYGAGTMGSVGSRLPEGMAKTFGLDPAKAKATEEWGKLMSAEAIGSMSQTLKGATTDFELRNFVERLADPTTPPEIRASIIDRMTTLTERQKEVASERIKGLKAGTYYGGTGGRPGFQTPGAGGATPPGATKPVPPEAAAALTKEPWRYLEFDAHYGPGAAQRVLKGQ